MAGYAETEIEYDRSMDGFPVSCPRNMTNFIDSKLFCEVITNTNAALKQGHWTWFQRIFTFFLIAVIIVMMVSAMLLFFTAIIGMILIVVTVFWTRHCQKVKLDKRRRLVVAKLAEETERCKSMGIRIEFSLLEKHSTATVVSISQRYGASVNKLRMLDWFIVAQAGDPAMAAMIMPVIIAPMAMGGYAAPQYGQPQYGQQQGYAPPQYNNGQPPQYNGQPLQYGQQQQYGQQPQYGGYQQPAQYPPQPYGQPQPSYQQGPAPYNSANPLGAPQTLGSVDNQGPAAIQPSASAPPARVGKETDRLL